MSPTNRHNDRFSLPFSRGYPHGRLDEGWDDELCNILDAQAREIPQYGTLDDRPEPDAPFAPLVWCVPTDGGPEWYVNTGTNWVRTDAGVIDLSTKADVGHDHSGGTLGTESEPVTSAHVGEGNVDELSVGTNSAPTLQDYTNVLGSVQSTTSTGFTAVGHSTGHFPSPADLSRGTMAVYGRIIVQLKSGDASTSAEISLQYSNDTDGRNNFFGFGTYPTSSTTYASVDSGWKLLDGITTRTDPFSLHTVFRTVDSTYTASAEDALVLIGVGP